MEGSERDDTQDWLLPAERTPPRLDELALRVDQAVAIARASEAAVDVIGEAALEAAEQARRAAELAENASAAALDASRRVADAQRAPAPEAPSEPEPAPNLDVDGPISAHIDRKSAHQPSARQPVPVVDDEELRRFVERADRVAARLQAV